ncbi:hypothetical protein GGS23DRAFT_567631 [Durotheca rogersii]|uniref:uncharacterized protein n=1 Tax=Durotheca rogersii TaxID=419775 RepID=UPI002220C906|nr:uncharacterized protein GGS23DRAFT_567631 [Durotheca rogersii]KAI5863573.1 hypothetical protein GGS23DRAFT_567631 [Durotheca rogersii]
MSDDGDPRYFGALAPELIDNVLFEIDSVRALSNSIIASRYARRRFEGRKHPVLWRVLQNELGPVLTDAKFLRLFPYADPGGSPQKWMAYRDGIHNMAAVHKGMLGSDGCGRAGGDVAVPSFAELTQLCRTLHKMNFLASTYVTAQLRSFSGEELATAPPSRAERLRVLRAFYRRQIVCNTWAPTRRELYWTNQDTAAISNTSEHQGERLGLFAAFEPWELQQVDHADWFVTRLCAALCLAGEEVAQPIGEAKFGDIFSHADHLVQYMREHPSITDTVLRTSLSPRRLRSQEVPDATPACSQYIERYSLLCPQFAWQIQRLESFPDPARDQHGEQQQQQEDDSGLSVNFVGDAVDLPPFGWVDALDGRYVNCFGDALVDFISRTVVPDDKEMYFACHVSLEAWRSAGFALWDQRRVKAIKELDRLRTLRTGWLVY